ncbi:MAG: universal stress protein [Bacteroidota bacterium]|nr:universal stress protein [Bacteroidota bacterium]
MKNFLIPFNLADLSESALTYAISIGVKSKTKLFFYPGTTSSDAGMIEENITFIRKAFTKLHFDADDSLVEIIGEESKLSNSEIKHLIEKYNIDLVIMGASHEGLKTTFFGSHVSELINIISCPVLSVPYEFLDPNIDRIGYATELFDIMPRIAEIVPFARLFNASIEAFHVYPVFPQTIDIETFDVKGTLLQLRTENQYEKINLHFIRTPLDNEPVKGILEFLSVYKPDLLVMCHKPKGLFDKLLDGSGATISVVKSSSIPILALNQQTACKLL